MLTEFRKAMQDQLAKDLGVSFVPGVLEGPVQRDLGSCYVMRVGEMSGRVEEAELLVVIRVFLQFQQQTEPELPYDPEPLERIVEALQDSVRGHQTGMGAWMQRLTAIDVDPVKQGVEALLLATVANAGVV